MSSMFACASNTLITGGIFTHNDVHYHGRRESSNILHRATATAAFHNSDERFDPPKCHPKTRLAVLNKIMKWIKWEEDIHAFIMWVYGPAGAGKSAIAQTIAEMCEEEMILLASFFFSRNDPSRSTVKPLIATIAYQITLNLPQLRDSILEAIERDPLIFSKSLAVQFKSLIVTPLQLLADAGFFKDPTSRRLVIIDGLDECSDSKVQRNILEVLANAQRQHQLPLIFLFASRPEQDISFAFGTGLLPSVTTRIALDQSYLPDEDIRLFLTDKFQEIRSTHRLRAYIPPHDQWPLSHVLEQLVKKSSGQFIYASTIIHYVSSIRHKPADRLNIILGICPPQKDLPFAELDALYMHILAGVEDIERVLEILSILLFTRYSYWTSPEVEALLSLKPGEVELYLGDLSSLITISSNQLIHILHASLTDFLIDPTRSKEFWINPPARHTAFARSCLQTLQVKENDEWMSIGFYEIVHHLKRAEMTPQLLDDLVNFSFHDLQDLLENHRMKVSGMRYSIFDFAPCFLEGLQKLPFSEANYIFQTLQFDFDGILCNVLEKYHSVPGFALLLGRVLRFTNEEQDILLPEMMASWYLVRQWGQGHILEVIGFGETLEILSDDDFISINLYPRYFTYLAELLENPRRTGTHVFDQQRYATAAKECLQLCLCSHNTFSKGTTYFSCRDKPLRRDKPSTWIRRLGVHSRIWRARHHFKVRQHKLLKLHIHIDQRNPFPENSPQHEYCRSLSYRGSLGLLPFLLEKSGVSLELAQVLRSRTFTTMAQRFPRRLRMAKEAITRYLLRVESEIGE